jgi:hypothetical protein
MPKLAAVKSKLLRVVETRNAVSDGAFAVTRIAACAVTTTKSTNLPGPFSQ